MSPQGISVSVVDNTAYPFADKMVASAAQIQSRIEELSKHITADYKDLCSKKNPLVLITIMNGAFMFASDLARALFRHGLYANLEFLQISSYEGSKSSTNVQFLNALKSDINGRHCLIIEDILDTGRTIFSLVKKLEEEYSPASLKTCVCVEKIGTLVIDVHADYVGFTVPNHFLVGYGLDFNETYRGVPDIVILNKAEYC